MLAFIIVIFHNIIITTFGKWWRDIGSSIWAHFYHIFPLANLGYDWKHFLFIFFIAVKLSLFHWALRSCEDISIVFESFLEFIMALFTNFIAFCYLAANVKASFHSLRFTYQFVICLILYAIEDSVNKIPQFISEFLHVAVPLNFISSLKTWKFIFFNLVR